MLYVAAGTKKRRVNYYGTLDGSTSYILCIIGQRCLSHKLGAKTGSYFLGVSNKNRRYFTETIFLGV